MTKKAKSKSFRAIIWRRFRRRIAGVVGLAIVVAMFLTAFFSPIIASNKPIVCKYDGSIYFPGIVRLIHQIPFTSRVISTPHPFTDANYWRLEESLKSQGQNSEDPNSAGNWALWPPIPFGKTSIEGRPLEAPSGTHLLGLDEVGRDVLARVIYGTSVSMRVGFISMGIATAIGLVLGALAGYFGRWIDMVISRVIEIVMCFPVFFLILAVLAWLPPRIENVMIVIGCTRWVAIARYSRGEFIKLRDSEYALAARALGAGPARIIFRHLLPNSLAPVMVSVTFGIAAAILVEAGLSWLGFGVQPPEPSWGNVLQQGYANMTPHMVLPACVAIFLAVLSFNLVGDGMRDAIDPRLQGAEGTG